MSVNGVARALAIVLAAGTIVSTALAEGEWKVSYLHDPKKPGERRPLGPETAALEDMHWLTVEYSEYGGFQPSMAMIVEPEKSREDLPEAETELGKMLRDMKRFTGGDEEESTDDRYSPERMAQMVLPIVRAALAKTNRFRIVDRGVSLQAALTEQDLGKDGRVNRRSAVRMGHIRGASYGVKTTVIEVNPEKEVRSIQVGAGVLGSAGAALGGIAVGGKVAFCRVSVAIVDLETGDVIFDTMVDGTASEKTRAWGGAAVGVIKKRLPLLGGAGAGSSDKKAAVISDAVNACAMKAAYHIATRMQDRPFQTSVARCDGSRMWIIGGSDLGLRPEMTLTLLSRGQAIVDPASGDTLDVETTDIGTVRVAEVKEKTSVCEVVHSTAAAKAGDLVRYVMAKP